MDDLRIALGIIVIQWVLGGWLMHRLIEEDTKRQYADSAHFWGVILWPFLVAIAFMLTAFEKLKKRR